MAYKHPVFSTLQKADFVEDVRAIENIMGKYTFLNCYKKQGEFFDKYWCKIAEDSSITLNDRRYAGYEAVRVFFVEYSDRITENAVETIRKLFPKEVAGKSEEELRGMGSNTVICFTTPVIEVAADRETAKGLWYGFGESTEVYAGGPAARWNFGKYGVDFKREDGVWKIWHMMICTDFDIPVGKNWGNTASVEYTGLSGIPAPEPSEKGDFYKTFQKGYRPMDVPRLPEPFPTFEDTFSY